jgi:putative ABC transport system permease protein
MLWLLLGEGAIVTTLGLAAGALASVLFVAAVGPWVLSAHGVPLRLAAPTVTQWTLAAAILVAGVLASLVPAWRAYRLSLADGLSPRI